MGVAVAIPPEELAVEPGAGADAEVKVRNTGQVVDRFSLDILGDAAGWASVEPATINLMPGEESTARITFAPPRTHRVTAGAVPFALRVMSHEDTEGSVISESVVVVEPFTTLVAELLPRTSSGARRGRHHLAVDNLGNQVADVSILPVDPDELLTFRLAPSAVVAAPGTATFVKFRAIPHRRFWKGPPRTIPFEVTVAAPGAEPVTLPGALLQKPLLASWLWKLAALLILIAVAVVVWYLLLKPELRSTATEVARKEAAPVAKAVGSAAGAADAAAARAEQAAVAAGLPARPVADSGVGPSGTLPVQEPGDDAPPAGGEAGDATVVGTSEVPAGPGAGAVPSAPDQPGAPGGAADPVGPAPAPALNPTATDFRVTTNAPPGAAGQVTPFTYTPAADRVVWISDVVLQNPRGDVGILQIRRGETVLLEFGLANFRDLDYHFIQPVRFTAEEPVVVAVECRNPGDTPCTPSVYFTGRTTAAAPTD